MSFDLRFDFQIKRDDLAPSIEATLSAADVAFDLTNSTVRFLMRDVRGDSSKVAAVAVVVTPMAGTVRYDWTGTDTDTIGTYKAEWEVTLPSGKKVTFPNNDWLLIQVVEDLG